MLPPEDFHPTMGFDLEHLSADEIRSISNDAHTGNGDALRASGIVFNPSVMNLVSMEARRFVLANLSIFGAEPMKKFTYPHRDRDHHAKGSAFCSVRIGAIPRAAASFNPLRGFKLPDRTPDNPKTSPVGRPKDAIQDSDAAVWLNLPVPPESHRGYPDKELKTWILTSYIPAKLAAAGVRNFACATADDWFVWQMAHIFARQITDTSAGNPFGRVFGSVACGTRETFSDGKERFVRFAPAIYGGEVRHHLRTALADQLLPLPSWTGQIHKELQECQFDKVQERLDECRRLYDPELFNTIVDKLMRPFTLRPKVTFPATLAETWVTAFRQTYNLHAAADAMSVMSAVQNPKGSAHNCL